MLDFSFTVPDWTDAACARADRLVLRECPGGVSRAAVAACFARGGVCATFGGVRRVLGKADRPPPGAVVEVAGLEDAASRSVAPEPDAPLKVAWESPDFVAVDKPAGQPCHPLSSSETGTLAGALVARYPETASVGDDPLQPGLVHRIDAGTSGLVLAARSRAAFDSARAQFAAKSVEKVYLALVAGKVSAPGGASGFLAHCDSFRGRMRVVGPRALPRGEKPMFAETFWTPVGAGPAGTTLLKVEIRTGVTHQIRCHLASAGHPVAGDAVYGGGAAEIGAAAAAAAPDGGHCLHSLSATLEEPGRPGRRTKISVPPPAWAGVPGQGPDLRLPRAAP